MVPRAYSYSSSPSPPFKDRYQHGSPTSIRQPGTGHMESFTTTKRTTTSKPPKIGTISSAAPSKPVVIPTRTRAGRRQSASHSKVERAGERLHDPKALPPSLAAFRAITSPADRKRLPVLRFNSAPPKFIEEELEDATDNETGGTASSLSSPHSWRLLLSPPEGVNDEEEDPELGSEATMLGSLSPLRSLSTESMPSLDTDTESAYDSSSPSTPGLPIRGLALQGRRSKSISSSVPEDSNSDHPLLIVRHKDDPTSSITSVDSGMEEVEVTAPKRPSLRSNLTASLRRLKTAARTLSASTVPALSSDDSQTRPTISQSSQFARERRPLPWAEPPDPALRRYLNPIKISPAELYSHRDHGDCKPSTALIQMQMYRPGARKSDQASAPPKFVLATSHDSPVNELVVSATPRHREPRENSDFLRVIVLEMNMRKVGKLSDVAPGRARLWLPARQTLTQSEEVGNETPRRWVSVNP